MNTPLSHNAHHHVRRRLTQASSSAGPTDALDETAEGRVADAVLAVLDMTRAAVREVGVTGDVDRQVVPAVGAGERPRDALGLAGAQRQRDGRALYPSRMVTSTRFDRRFLSVRASL